MIRSSSSLLDSSMNLGGLAIGTQVVVDGELFLGYHWAWTYGLSTGFIQRPSSTGCVFCFLVCWGCGAGGKGTPWKTNLWLLIRLLIPFRLLFFTGLCILCNPFHRCIGGWYWRVMVRDVYWPQHLNLKWKIEIRFILNYKIKNKNTNYPTLLHFFSFFEVLNQSLSDSFC